MFAPKKIKKMKKLILYLLPVLLLTSCSDDSIKNTLEEDYNKSVEAKDLHESKVETATEADGPVIDIYYGGQKLKVQVHGSKFIYQGDILLDEDLIATEPVKLIYEKGDTPAVQKSVGRTAARWPNATVYYAIDNSLPDQQRVLQAIDHWEENTDVEFKVRGIEQNYIYFEGGEGCSSNVGMTGGKQIITMGEDCDTGSAIHEIGHALGLWHEHSRIDRDNYLRVNFENIEEDKEHNFKTYLQQEVDGVEYTNELDFQSIMMYPSYAFSKNKLPTLVRLNGSTFAAQREVLSPGDRAGIAKMYAQNDDGSLAEQVYMNGYYYAIDGVLVYRMHDRWYTYTKSGWKEITQKNDYWFFV